jgi:hypothetical protein
MERKDLERDLMRDQILDIKKQLNQQALKLVGLIDQYRYQSDELLDELLEFLDES